ncbi:MAG: diguanylate cyclase [Lachnospiraceae bacterium]
MNQEDNSALDAMIDILEILLTGRQCHPIKIQSSLPKLQTLAGKINQLIKNLNEMNLLAADLSEGKLNGPIPPRHNYMAGSMKRLHSRLSALTCSLRQLQSGHVISKQMDTGELFEVCNELIDRIAAASTEKAERESYHMPAAFNSWRCHQLMKTLDLLHTIILEVNDSGHVVYANHSAQELFGNITHVSDQTKNTVLKFISENITGCKENLTFPVIREVYEASCNTWYRITSNRFWLPDGQMFYVNSIENISDWKLNEHHLKLSASMDLMSGTYNRKTGLEELQKLLTCADTPQTHCIAFIDIDDLKNINDHYGHCEGDYAIKSIANVFVSSVRGSDIVCRYGGDEFLVIFRSCPKDTAEKIVARMQEQLESLNRNHQKPFTLSFSHGIVPFSNSADSCPEITDLLKLADQRMYCCKKQKKQKRNSCTD